MRLRSWRSALAASGTYFWNDVLDVESDRAHPTKRNRPIAAGIVPIPTARLVGVVLLAASLGVAALTGRWQTVAIVGTYIVLTISYSVVLKQIAVVDLVVIASGFVLRAAGGAVAVDVPMSDWFVLCTTFGSLFIVAGKRYAELNDHDRLGVDAGASRATLNEYSVGFLRDRARPSRVPPPSSATASGRSRRGTCRRRTGRCTSSRSFRC